MKTLFLFLFVPSTQHSVPIFIVLFCSKFCDRTTILLNGLLSRLRPEESQLFWWVLVFLAHAQKSNAVENTDPISVSLKQRVKKAERQTNQRVRSCL